MLVWNAMAAKVPALVVQPESARDVAETVAFARDHELLLSVKGGGHNIAGTSVAEGGLTLDMSRLRDVAVDPEARLAHAGAGSLLQDVDHATQEHGLATVLGFVSEVGVAGLTLGGGFGYLSRRFGWSVDNLEEVEIVTADGEIRTANRERERRSSLGGAGRRRQLRRRHAVHVPPARGRADHHRRSLALECGAGATTCSPPTAI